MRVGRPPVIRLQGRVTTIGCRTRERAAAPSTSGAAAVVTSMWKDSSEIDMSLAENYRRFAAHEAEGQCPLYARLARHVAESRALIAFLSELPSDRRQPNLFFAAVRHVAGVPADGAELEAMVQADTGTIARVMLSRTTQTNEAGRCATLLPALAGLDGPLALIEVGASAGLCLIPDHYGYDFGRRRIEPPDESRGIAPTLGCTASANTPLPDRRPAVVWRAGLDLNPLDIDRPADIAWLRCLVWPGQHARLARLEAAIAVARTVRPRVEPGDLRHDLGALIARAPAGTTVVVFHTAVLSYVSSPADRARFAETVRDAGAVWLSNEAPHVFPAIAERLAGPPPRGRFLLSHNGTPIAWTGPHGQSIDWIA